jgi:hypothetical protein
VLVPPGDAGAIATATLALREDGPRRVEMARAGRAAAIERFGIETAADLRAQVYEAALEHAASRRSTVGRISAP